MITCAIVSCLIFAITQLACGREDARPSPTDMPYSSRDILNKKEDLKTYLKNLKSVKVAEPDPFCNSSNGFGHLLVENEKIRIPYAGRGLGEVTKMYLDQDKLNRYLKVLDLELQRTPSTIELDSSKIVDYVKMLNNINKNEAKSADLISRSRIKLMKGGMADNLNGYEKGRQPEGDVYYGDDYQINKRDAGGIERINKKLIDTSGENALFFDSDIDGKKRNDNFNDDSGFKRSVHYSEPASYIALNEDNINENYDFDTNQQLDSNSKTLENEKQKPSKTIAANQFKGGYDDNGEPSDQEWIENLQILDQPAIATGYPGLVSARGKDVNPLEVVENSGDRDSSNEGDTEYNDENPVSNEGSYENEQKKDELLINPLLELAIPNNHVIKGNANLDQNKKYMCNKRNAEIGYPKPEEPMGLEGIRYDDSKLMQLNGTNQRSLSVENLNIVRSGTAMDTIENYSNSLKKPTNNLSQISVVPNNTFNPNKTSFSPHLADDMFNNKDLHKAIDIKTYAYFTGNPSYNFSSTEQPSISYFFTNLSEHKIFPLSPQDEIFDVPRMKYFEKCLSDSSRGMPTKPPNMFSKYYISRLKKFEKYESDSNMDNFFKRSRAPVFGTKENEVSKILNVNLGHLHIDKGALYKIIGKALKIDEENSQDYAPPKWLEHKYDELIHASHRGQNTNDYDYIDKSKQSIITDRFNIRYKKESVHDMNQTSYKVKEDLQPKTT